MSIKYPLASSSWDHLEHKALQEVIKRGMFSMGQKVEECEKHFAEHFGSKYAVMVNSGSSANLLMIGALMYRSYNKLNKGDEVIVPAVSWGTTYFPLNLYGLKLVFVDIDKETLNYDLKALENAAKGKKVKLIMCVNLLGNPNEFKEVNEIAVKHNLEVIEDNCESMGASYNNKMAGTWGLMGSFSSFFSHHISTMEGGFVLTDEEELYHIMLSLRAHGWTRNLPKENLVCNKSTDSFTESYRFVLPGFNLRPLEMSGALGIEQLKKLPNIVKCRRDNAFKFKEATAPFNFITIQKEIGMSSWFGFSITLNDNCSQSREQILKTFRYHGFEARPVVAGNFVNQDVMKYLDFRIDGELSNANVIDTNSFFIGNHHYPMTDAINELPKVLEKCK